jgi:pentatricopeptide repeat protein
MPFHSTLYYYSSVQFLPDISCVNAILETISKKHQAHPEELMRLHQIFAEKSLNPGNLHLNDSSLTSSPSLDSNSYNILIYSFAKKGIMDKAIQLFNEMKSKNIPLNLDTFHAVMSGYSKQRNYIQISILFQQLKVLMDDNCIYLFIRFL